MIELARVLHYGLKGRDVTAVQLALRVAKYRKDDPTGRYGTKTVHQVNEFKHAHGIREEHGYGPKAHAALWRDFGSAARTLYGQAAANIAHHHMVHHVVGAAIYGWNERAYMHYTQDGRRMQDFGPPPNVPNWTDCSGFATWCYKSGGAPDPNGFGYNGYGFTGTQLLHGTRISQPTLACLVFYGTPTVTHVAVYVGDGRVVSMGNELGPQLLPISFGMPINQIRSYF
jgi:hypothetical protein